MTTGLIFGKDNAQIFLIDAIDREINAILVAATNLSFSTELEVLSFLDIVLSWM